MALTAREKRLRWGCKHCSTISKQSQNVCQCGLAAHVTRVQSRRSSSVKFLFPAMMTTGAISRTSWTVCLLRAKIGSEQPRRTKVCLGNSVQKLSRASGSGLWTIGAGSFLRMPQAFASCTAGVDSFVFDCISHVLYHVHGRGVAPCNHSLPISCDKHNIFPHFSGSCSPEC